MADGKGSWQLALILLVNITIKGIKMKLVGDSSLHFVPLRMTDICVVEESQTSYQKIMFCNETINFY